MRDGQRSRSTRCPKESGPSSVRGLFEVVSQNSQERLQVVDPEKKVYLVKVTPRYRAVISHVDNGTVVVQDIVSEESLKQYKHSEKAGGPQG